MAYTKPLLSLLLTALLLVPALGQDCGRCTKAQCCSKWGFCGTTEAYCGKDCIAGPCHSKATPTPSTGSSSVASVVTPAFFNRIANQAASTCKGKGFYTHAAFIKAAAAYPQFGTTKLEIAAFFAHVTHETGHLCYITEIGASQTKYCEASAKYPCAPGQYYYGRGPFQLTWNYNYIDAGKSIGFDGLNNPGIVERDPVIAFKAALWFWTRNCQSKLGQGFGSTIRCINGIECGGAKPAAVENRIRYFRELCSQLGIAPGSNLSC